MSNNRQFSCLFGFPSLFHQLESIIFLFLSPSAFYCIPLFSFLFFHQSWSFSHIGSSVSNPKDNYAWFILRKQAFSTQGLSSAQKKKKKKIKVRQNQNIYLMVVSREFFYFRRHSQSSSSVRMKRNQKDPDLCHFWMLRHIPCNNGRCCEESEIGIWFLKSVKCCLLMFWELYEDEKCRHTTAVQSTGVQQLQTLKHFENCS
jgi:hypothetical protein